MVFNFTCACCAKPFTANRNNRKYCSVKCRTNSYDGMYNGPNVMLKLSTGTTGAIAELLASADLMRRGYEVYRALSQASDCDLLGIKDGQIHKFEVRTGRYSVGSRRLYWSNSRISGKQLIIVTHSDNKVHYPEINTIKI